MTRFRHILLLLTLLFTTSPFASSATNPASLKVSLDSAFLLMGKATTLHIELVDNEDSKGTLLIPADSICGKVEILKVLPADTSVIGSGRREIKQDILLQSFDSGTYRLNPLKYVQGSDTVLSNRLVLKVVPAMVDSMVTIHDYSDVVDVNRHIVDYLPDFLADYGLWILALIAAGVVAYFVISRMLGKKSTEEKVKEKPVPPYEKAMDSLNRLRSDKLCEQGREKEFYTRLTDILRIYLNGRFGINAMEMTSTQIRHSLQSNEETRMTRRNMDAVLEMADFVKFARMRPLPDDNTRAFNAAIQFVEDTKPAPVPDKEEGDEATNSETEKKTNK